MKIQTTAISGTMESSDIHITIEANQQKGIQIYLKSPVIKQFGDEIKETITRTLHNMDIDSAIVRAIDKGALNCTIEARVATAAMKATGKEMPIWEVTARG